MSTAQQALETFADPAQNPDLLRLEGLLSRFNLFEAVGVVRHELRHSDFLAYLLDPRQTHGLGSALLTELVQTAGLKHFISDDWNFHEAAVFREWHHVDILVDDVNRFAVIVENKIGTSEHSDQLNRYQIEFNRHYPGYKVLALYLTPDGDAPSSPDYHAVSYTQVCGVIEKMAQEHRATLDGEIVIVLEHYAQMLRRHIVSDSDVAQLCRRIYQEHKQALDLIIEHRPDQQALINEYLKSLIAQKVELHPGGSGKNYITFSLREWQNSPRSGGEFGDNICWILFFVFGYIADGLRLELQIGPGDTVEREKHLQMAQKHRFRGYCSKLTGKYSRIASVSFLSASDYEKSLEEIEAIISEKWAEYLRDELPRIIEAIRQEAWLWELPQITP